MRLDSEQASSNRSDEQAQSSVSVLNIMGCSKRTSPI